MVETHLVVLACNKSPEGKAVGFMIQSAPSSTVRRNRAYNSLLRQENRLR